MNELKQQQRNKYYHSNADGHWVKNLFAYWLPDFKLEKEISGTIYTVTGDYDGTEMLDKKLSRILAQNMEDKHDR